MYRVFTSVQSAQLIENNQTEKKKEGMASHDHIQDFHTLHLLVMQSKAVKESKVTFELRQEVNVL